MTHELKIQKQWADAKLAGEKPFEIRRNDRGFQKGDTVLYKVVDPKTSLGWRDESGEPHTLEKLAFQITYVIEGKDGLERGYCVFADVPSPKRPVSADLRSGATPSNGTTEPLAPPPPLADTSDKDVHTDAIIAEAQKKCKGFIARPGSRICIFAASILSGGARVCPCKVHSGWRCSR